MELLVRLLSDEEGVKYVQTKLYVKMGLAQEYVRTLLETASKCGKQVSQKPLRIPAIAKPDGPANEVNDTKSPQ